jgi:transcriptional regulator with PAS, ATPase and Fis domain
VPVGSTKPCKADVRIICATNRNLKQMVSDGKFRPDLYYRLDVIHLEIPPLRSRREYIIPLAEYFLYKQADHYNRGRKKLTQHTARFL